MQQIRLSLLILLASSVSVSCFADGSSILNNGDTILQQQHLYNVKINWSNVYQSMAILQRDGNFILYTSTNSFQTSTIKWSSKTQNLTQSSKFSSQSQGPYLLRMQVDNNLVMYDGGGRAVWETGTAEMGRRGTAYLILQIDGNMAIYDRDRLILWASNSTNHTQTTKQPNTHYLVKQ